MSYENAVKAKVIVDSFAKNSDDPKWVYKNITLFKNKAKDSYKMNYTVMRSWGESMLSCDRLWIKKDGDIITVHAPDPFDRRRRKLLLEWDAAEDTAPYESDGDFPLTVGFAWNLANAVRKFQRV